MEFDEALQGDERAVVARAIREFVAQRQGDGEETQVRLWHLYLDARVAGVCRDGALELLRSEARPGH